MKAKRYFGWTCWIGKIREADAYIQVCGICFLLLFTLFTAARFAMLKNCVIAHFVRNHTLRES